MKKSTSSSLATARTWLERCQTKHLSCCTKQSDFLPTRLIDIGSESLPRLSLCFTAALQSCVRYTTLSHCWGDPALMPLTLTTENINSLMLSIDFELLPKTFQQAVQVSRFLGIQYIWIDSLCIIQDNPTDWEMEAVLMSQVYSHGVFNISATAAENGSTGLFSDRDPAAVRPVNICLPQRDGTTGFYTFSTESEFGVWYRLKEAPLNRRGWVLQERLLSRKNILFARNQIFMECSETRMCETFPISTSVSFKAETKVAFGKVTLGQRLSSQEFDDLWYDVVSDYTTCFLSKDTDRLVAIGGLATVLQEMCGDRYLAGLWYENLISQLCWRRTGLEKSSWRRNENQFPVSSWSEGGGYIAPSKYLTFLGLDWVSTAIASFL